MKHVHPSRSLAVALACGALAVGIAAGPLAQTRAGAATAQASPTAAPTFAATTSASPTPIVATTATPGPSPSASAEATKAPRGRRSRLATPGPDAAPSPTETPTSPAFATLDGSWEVQIQTASVTTYSYLDIKQNQSGIAGIWRLNHDHDKYSFDGTYDGRLIRIVAKTATGDVILSGYVDGASDMVGTVDYGKGDPVAFTAEHRASSKGGNFLQKISPPGGIGGH